MSDKAETKLLPREPTPEMWAAYMAEMRKVPGTIALCPGDTWRLMWDAALDFQDV